MAALTQDDIRLMASFKLMVKRSLQKVVDLEALAHDPAYARTCLAEVEDAADSEEMLVAVLRLRQLLVPAPVAEPVKPAPEAAPAGPKYQFGARS